MKSKNITLLVILGVIPFFSFAQIGNPYISFTGKIINSENNEPVAANLSFELMPNADDIGTLKSNQNGEVNFYMRPEKKYSITVQAEGFFAYAKIIDVAKETTDGQINLDIVLKPGGVGHLIRLDQLIFAQGKADITEESYQSLDELALMMRENQAMEIQLEGHTDFRGSATSNLRLSELRVSAVKNYLVAKGIATERLITKAFGGTVPITRDNTPEARALNRRVEVRILKYE